MQRELVYALAVGQESVHLTDGRRHQVRHAWSFCDSLPSWFPLLYDQTMEWSPDGTRFAIKGSESIIIMQADVFAESKMLKVPDGRGYSW